MTIAYNRGPRCRSSVPVGEDRGSADVAETYLVTGGAGFIGSHIVDELLSRGHPVKVLDNFSTGRRSNIAHVAGDIDLVEGDVRSYERANAAVRGADVVIHLAALPSVPRSVQDPLTTTEVNVTGTLNALLAARDQGVRRVVIASSSSVYGANDFLPKHEELIPHPISPYGVSKLAAEQYAMAFNAVYGLETVALRYFNVFGPRQDPNSQYSGVVALFLRLALEGVQPTVCGDGAQTRDFTYVANVVQATLLAAEAPQASGSVLNIGCGASYSVLDLIAAIEEATGSKMDPLFGPERRGDVRHSFANIDRARARIGYEPLVTFAEGIQRTHRALFDVVSEGTASC
jgi:nucleoside-diphosphate-sugar epimerase